MTRRLSAVTVGDLIDWTVNGLFAKGNPSNHGVLQYQGDTVHTDFQLTLNGPQIAATGNGTFNHLCKQFGAASGPSDFSFNSYTGVPFGSETMGFNTITSTQVTVATGAGLAWNARGWTR